MISEIITIIASTISGTGSVMTFIRATDNINKKNTLVTIFSLGKNAWRLVEKRIDLEYSFEEYLKAVLLNASTEV